jgi:hypothetical protein
MKIQLIKDFEQFGVNSVIDVDQPTGNRLVSDGIGIQVPDDTRSRKYRPGQQLESLCVPLNEQNTTITTPPTFIASIGAEMEDKDKTPTTRRQFFTTKK